MRIIYNKSYIHNGEYLKTKKTQQQIKIHNALFIKETNRHIKAHEEEDIRKEWRHQRRENILGNKTPPTSTQPKKSPGNSPIQEPSTATGDVPEALFYINSISVR